MFIGKESEHVEFKKSTSEDAKAIISMCAILNKNNKGTIYFGVNDQGEVVGQQIGKDTLNHLSRKIAQEIKPLCYYEIEERSTPEGLSFIEIQFYGKKTPYSAFDKYYLRLHDEDRIMSAQMLREYFLSQKMNRDDWELSDSEKKLDCINEKQLKAYVKRANQAKRLNVPYSSKKEMLSSLHLLTQKGTLNRAGEALFSKEKPVLFKVARFATETRSTILSMNNFYGNIYECIDYGLEFYSNNISWYTVFEGNSRRKDYPEIPLEGIKEIVINAFAHGDYDANTNFELDIFADRVSIYSPGYFPSPYTPEQFAEEKLPPIPLNDLINSVLYKDNTIEQFSTGFDRVFKICKKEEIAYEYHETMNGFRFDFVRPSYLPKKKFNETEQRVLREIELNRRITAKELAMKAKVTERTIHRAISSLKKNGKIERVGSDKTGYYRIVP